MSLTKKKNKSAIQKRIEFYQQPRYRAYNNRALICTIIRLEWENHVLKEEFKEHKLPAKDTFNKHKESAFRRALTRSLDIEFTIPAKEAMYRMPDSTWERLKKKVKGED